MSETLDYSAYDDVNKFWQKFIYVEDREAIHSPFAPLAFNSQVKKARARADIRVRETLYICGAFEAHNLAPYHPPVFGLAGGSYSPFFHVNAAIHTGFTDAAHARQRPVFRRREIICRSSLLKEAGSMRV
jgi:hypothetical protein